MKICVVEYNDWHDELIPSFVLAALELGCEIDVYLTRNNINKAVLYMINNPKLKIFEIKERFNNKTAQFIERVFYRSFYNIKTYTSIIDNVLINHKQYELIIFNSSEPLPVFYRLKNFSSNMLSVLHNAEYAKHHHEYSSYYNSAKIKLLVLSEYIKDYLSPIKSDVFHPVFLGKIKPPPQENTIRFAIQGNFDPTRRNYLSLIEAAKDLISSKITNFEFHFIGNTSVPIAQLYKKQVNNNQLSKYFIFYDRILPYHEYYDAIQSCSFILPLLDNSNLAYLPYFESKCSSSINLAIALNILPVVPYSVAETYKIGNSSITYSNTLKDGLQKAICISPEEHKQLVQAINKTQKQMLEHNKRIISKAINNKK